MTETTDAALALDALRLLETGGDHDRVVEILALRTKDERFRIIAHACKWAWSLLESLPGGATATLDALRLEFLAEIDGSDDDA